MLIGRAHAASCAGCFRTARGRVWSRSHERGHAIRVSREALNRAKRRAATRGVGAAASAPLLAIAGAGSGKTTTLAHRVTHLMVSGVEPLTRAPAKFSSAERGRGQGASDRAPPRG
ncbi:MAG: hypothetical protein EOP23_01430 [Hyphomicrobiales bacterium]|nr:MAG: hypothetical protein EOP23_01430 [Hyphomicrobiales bacterium]